MRNDHDHGKSKSQGTTFTLEGALGRLKQSGLKLTGPRKSILSVLIEKHGPFTAEEIFGMLPRRICDMATVYRSLASLVEAAILRRVEFGDGSSRYELAESGDSHHHHVICVECKRVEIIDDADLEEIDRFAKKRGFSNVSHTLEFFGTCPDCK